MNRVMVDGMSDDSSAAMLYAWFGFEGCKEASDRYWKSTHSNSLLREAIAEAKGGMFMDFRPEEDPQQYLLRVAFALDEGHTTKLDATALGRAASKHAAWNNEKEPFTAMQRVERLIAFINHEWDVQISFDGHDYLMAKPQRVETKAARQGRANDDGVFYVEEV